MAAGTPEQKERFLKRFKEGKPKWGAMAITEPSFGSDSSQVTTTATRDGDHWVINGTKIFCTAGEMAAEKSEGFVVVWATVDKSRGTSRDQAVRRRAQHARHDRRAGREQTRHPRLRYRRAHLRQLPDSAGRICWAAPKSARKAASRT